MRTPDGSVVSGALRVRFGKSSMRSSTNTINYSGGLNLAQGVSFL
ncbi:hypothetical protein [Streptomyces sp. NPDC048191]